MRIHALIAATLAALGPACTSTFGCDPPKEQYKVDAALTEAEVGELLQTWGYEDRAAIPCESACAFAYRRDRGWESGNVETCTLTIAPTPGATPEAEVGSVQCEGEGYEYFCEGRRPLGHVEAPAGDGGLGDYLARCAHLEAASIVAFEELAAALTAAGAPAPLIARCRQAAADERRHADLVGALARAHGRPPPPAERRPVAPTLAAIALDNAREGCVLETWAALRAAWLAAHAPDPALRRLYADLAADEADHAQLSWDLHTWLMGQVDQDTRAAAVARLRAAIAALPAIAAAQAALAPPALAVPPARAHDLAARFADGLSAAA